MLNGSWLRVYPSNLLGKFNQNYDNKPLHAFIWILNLIVNISVSNKYINQSNSFNNVSFNLFSLHLFTKIRVFSTLIVSCADDCFVLTDCDQFDVNYLMHFIDFYIQFIRDKESVICHPFLNVDIL